MYPDGSGNDPTAASTPSATTHSSVEGIWRTELPHSSPPSHMSPVQNAVGPAVISQRALPTYRQVSMSGEGSDPSGHPSTGSVSPPTNLNSSLPDILHSHMVPQIPPPRPNQHRHQRNGVRRPSDGAATRGNGHRQRPLGDRTGRPRAPSSRIHSSSSTQSQEGSCKEPCVKCVVVVTTLRWVLTFMSVLGVSCVVTGIVLAALNSPGTMLFLAIMFIGLGVLLVIVVAVGWKCTPRGHEPLHALFGIGNFRQHHRRPGRPARHRSREGTWFGGMLYPEFQHRRPPPSYAASMQDYQNQVTQEQLDNQGPRNSIQSNGGSLPSSPPPSYRSRASTAHSGILTAFSQIQDGEHSNSRPPTYRSRAPSRRPSLPLEVENEHIELEVEDGERTQSVSFASPPSAHIHRNDVEAVRVTASLDLSYQPSSGTVERYPDTATSCRHSALSQIHTVPLRRANELGNQNLTTQSENTHTLSSDPPDPESSPYHQQDAAAGSHSGGRLPSSHHRMASEDRKILEQTLQTLEEQLNESIGITNEVASLDDPDQTTERVNTYL